MTTVWDMAERFPEIEYEDENSSSSAGWAHFGKCDVFVKGSVMTFRRSGAVWIQMKSDGVDRVAIKIVRYRSLYSLDTARDYGVFVDVKDFHASLPWAKGKEPKVTALIRQALGLKA